MNSRTEREQKAYNDRVFEKNTEWHKRFIHVFESPNTLRNESLINE